MPKYYENLKMLSRVTAKNVGDVFLTHTVLCNVTFLKKSPLYLHRVP